MKNKVNDKEILPFNTARKWNGNFEITNSNTIAMNKYVEYKSNTYRCSTIVDLYYYSKLHNVEANIDDVIAMNEISTFFNSISPYSFEQSTDIFMNAKLLDDAIDKYRKYVESAKKYMPWLECVMPRVKTNSEGLATFDFLWYKVKELYMCLNDMKFEVIIGKPGTGKTYEAIQRTKNDGVVQVISLSNLVGNNFVARASRTEGVTSKYTAISYTKARFCDDVCEGTVIFEECSMIDSSVIDIVISKCRSANRVIFLGDTNQLPGFLGFGNVLYGLVSTFPEHVTELSKNHRCSKEVVSTMDSIVDNGVFEHIDDREKTLEMWYDLIKNKENCVVLTLKNDRVDFINETMLSYVASIDDKNTKKVEKLSKVLEENTDDYQKRVNTLEKLFLLALSNDYTIPLRSKSQITTKYEEGGKTKYKVTMFNNELCTCRYHHESSTWYITSNTSRLHCFSTNYFWEVMKYFDMGYAMTVHKSQGLEFDYVWYISPDNAFFENRNLAYVGFTRSKIKTFVTSNNEKMKKLNFKNIFRCFKK